MLDGTEVRGIWHPRQHFNTLLLEDVGGHANSMGVEHCPGGNCDVRVSLKKWQQRPAPDALYTACIGGIQLASQLRKDTPNIEDCVILF